MGEVPAPPTTGGAPLLVALQPAILSTVMLMLPAGARPVPESIWLMNACKYPTTETVPPVAGKTLALSRIGMVTIELLVVTSCVLKGPLSAVIFMGLFGH